MATQPTTADVYTKRALLLLRYVNTLSGAQDKRLRLLGRVILGYLSTKPEGLRALRAMLKSITQVIEDTYDDIADDLGTSLEELLDIEAAWAIGIGGAGDAASASALKAAFKKLLILGYPIDDIVTVAADQFRNDVVAAIREAVLLGDDAKLRAVLGDGAALRNGLLDKARRQMRAVTDTAVHSAAYAGRLSTWQASGVNALQWHSILDNRTTVGCAIRDGKLYTLAFEPIGHDIPIERPPPRHYNCRSILLPLVLPDPENPPAQYQKQTFDAWLKKHSQAEQDAMLGAGRADMWRRGIITLSDLIGQRGQTLTLGDLRHA